MANTKEDKDKKVEVEEKSAEKETNPEKSEAPEDSAEETVVIPEKFQSLVEQVENMSVLELNELVKLLEKRFGVQAGAVALAGNAAGGEGEVAEEKSTFTVELSASGDQKIGVIKVVKEVLALGLKDAKDLVDGAPVVLKEGMPKEEAEELKKRIEEVGGQVMLK